MSTMTTEPDRPAAPAQENPPGKAAPGPAGAAARPRDRGGRPRTVTEQARHAQFIQVTIEVVARHGYAGTSLARIAEAAGVSKAAVLYHFPTRDAVVQAAYASVIEGITAHVGAAVAPRSGAEALAAYIRSLVGYLREHPDHVRMIMEAITGDNGITDTPQASSRWQTVAGLIDQAKAAGHYRPDVDSPQVAVIVNGAIDAIVSQRLADPEFDSTGAADTLVRLLDRALRT